MTGETAGQSSCSLIHTEVATTLQEIYTIFEGTAQGRGGDDLSPLESVLLHSQTCEGPRRPPSTGLTARTTVSALSSASCSAAGSSTGLHATHNGPEITMIVGIRGSLRSVADIAGADVAG